MRTTALMSTTRPYVKAPHGLAARCVRKNHVGCSSVNAFVNTRRTSNHANPKLQLTVLSQRARAMPLLLSLLQAPRRKVTSRLGVPSRAVKSRRDTEESYAVPSRLRRFVEVGIDHQGRLSSRCVESFCTIASQLAMNHLPFGIAGSSAQHCRAGLGQRVQGVCDCIG